MNLSGIISISGKPGLSTIVSQLKNGLIAESLIDGKRFPVHGTEKISSIEDISIYTYEEDVLLSKVFEKIFEKEDGKKAIDHKSSNDELKAYFEKVLPNYDKERVYISDIKKVIQWYNLLLDKDLLNKEDEKEADKKEEKESDKASTSKAKKPTDKKPATKAKSTSKAPKPSSQKGSSKVSTPRKAK